jgi:hypothetical protein
MWRCCSGSGRDKKTIVVDDQEVVITVKGRNVTFRMSSSSNDRDHLDAVPEPPKRKHKRSFESNGTNSTRSSRLAFDSQRYDVEPYVGHAKSVDSSTGRVQHRDPFESAQ